MEPDLTIPEFLRGRGPNAMANRPPRWKRIKPKPRPEGQRWEQAERWEVFVGQELLGLACGRRRLWVVEGRKWARLHDGESQVKVPMALWRQTQRSGKQIL